MKREQALDQSWEVYLSELCVLAANQPTVALEALQGRTTHEQFRGNYYRRFPEINHVRENTASPVEVFYVRMVMERFGYDLVRFYDENEMLCDDICDGVAAKAAYDILQAEHDRLLMAEDAGHIAVGSALSLQKSVGHPLGLEAIGIYYWDQLNPLLVQAYERMDQQTLNAPFLTR